jgi:hypothetical protein
MNDTIDAEITDIAVSETIGGGEQYVVFLANQEPVDGNLTIVDLTKARAAGRLAIPAILRRSVIAARSPIAAPTVNGTGE